MTGLTELDLAELRAAEARVRLNTTLSTLQTRLAPATIARGALDGIADKSGQALSAGVESARRNPGKVVGGLAILAAVLARRPIGALLGRMTRKRHRKPKPPAK